MKQAKKRRIKNNLSPFENKPAKKDYLFGGFVLEINEVFLVLIQDKLSRTKV